MTPEELVARGDAPVKVEFVRKVARIRVDAVSGSLGAAAPPTAVEGNQGPAKKKSKNQMKRERGQQRFGKAELCSMLVMGSCRFGQSCRFNHDVEAFLQAKPPDLPGPCPFDSTGACPYGITCRWASKHRHADPLSQQAQQEGQQAQQQAEECGRRAGAPQPAEAPTGNALLEAVQGGGYPATAAATALHGRNSVMAAAGNIGVESVEALPLASSLEATMGAPPQRQPAGQESEAGLANVVVRLTAQQEEEEWSGAAQGASNPGAAPPQAQQEEGQQRRAASFQPEQQRQEEEGRLRAGQQQQQQQKQQEGQEEHSTLPGGGGGQQWWWRRDGTIPGRVVGPLALGEPVVESVNAMGKGLQSVLRKEQYDFSRADNVLASMGITNTRSKHRQQQRQQRREQWRGGTGAEGPQARQAQHAEQQEAQHAEQQGAQHGVQQGLVQTPAAGDTAPPAELKGAAALDEAGVTNGVTLMTDSAASNISAGAGLGSGGAPSAKRVRLDKKSPALPGGVVGAAGAGPPADAVVSDASFLSGLGPEVAAASNGTAAAAAEPAKQAQRGTAAGSMEGGGYIETRVHPREKTTIDFRDKTYLAPLTTVGNLPFRRLCKGLGADITCGEMALATNLLQGQASEWALLKRHPSEDCFGVQVCGGFPDSMARCAQLIDDTCQVDFVDINFGCPIDLICSKGGGSAALLKPQRMEQIVRSMSSILSCPLTFKMRKGYHDGQDVAHTIIPKAHAWGAAAVTLHGRTREQRYSRLADWDYIHQCASLAPAGLQLVGNGDCFSYEDYYRCLEGGPGGHRVAAIYIARGALVKPWIFTEIKERRHWDISAGERFDLLRRYCSMGLEHWGSDGRGVETTRRFLMEWLSFTHRYIPLALLEVVPQQLHWRPPGFVGRNDLETLLASDNAADWVKISEMLLGPAPPGYVFSPKHKATSYAKRETADVSLAMDEY
ncbi:hypothetical protein N2152v2_000345 [Parachlorella kessleri]